MTAAWPVLDEAAAKGPHINVPLSMSVNLAQQTEGPRRLEGAVEQLLALGWPGEDEYFRTESPRQADLLAKLLREDGRSRDADPCWPADHAKPGTFSSA